MRLRSEDVVLAIDVGTSSVRALAYDARAEQVPGVNARVPHAPSGDVTGANTFDADEVFGRIVQVLDDAHAQLAALGRTVCSVAMDTFVGNLLGVDADGRPCTALITYADTRSAAALARLQERLDAAATYDHVGAPLHTAYWSAQLAWLRETCPHEWEATARWLTLGDYVLWRLTGAHVCSYSAASWTGLLNRRLLSWDSELCHTLGVGATKLSPLARAANARANLRAEYATRWHLFRAARWFPAIGDGVAANVGSGCVNTRNAAVTIGTTAAVRVVVPGAPATIPAGLWCYRMDERRSLVGGAFSEGGNLIAWLRELMGDSAPSESEINSEPPSTATFLPLVAGERAPGWRPDARGTLAGLALNTTAAQIAAAAMDGVAVRLSHIVELLRSAAPDVQCFVASGGGLLASQRWMQAIADALGEPLYRSTESEATSRGTAMLALEAMGVLALEDVAPHPVDPVLPDATRHALYAEARTRQQRLYLQTVV